MLVRARSRLRHPITIGCVVLALSSVLAGAAGAATYHVDNQNPAATDGGPGTADRTISAAVTQHGGPGTTILVGRGTDREEMSVSASGSSGSPFVQRATGPGVRVACADDFSATDLWIQVSGNVWLASSVTWDPKQVFVDGARLTPSTSMPGSIGARTFTWVSGQGLYAKARHTFDLTASAGVEASGDPDTPAELSPSNASPNPSRLGTAFELALPRAGHVIWGIYDLQGRALWSEERVFPSGRVQLSWDGTRTGGERAEAGVYLARVQVEDASLTRRLIRF